jgi:hypothetical protein
MSNERPAPDGALDRVLQGIEEAQRALAEYVDPQGPGEAETLDRLLGILDHRDFVSAVIALAPERPAAGERSQSAEIYPFPTQPELSSRKP